MSSNIDLKALWGQQEAPLPDKNELLKKMKKFKTKNMRKLIITNIHLLLTSLVIAFFWYYYQPELITTKAGIVIAILGMALYLIVYNRTAPLLTKNNLEISSNEYLQQLLQLKKKQQFLQTTMMNIYFIMLIVGLTLYMVEYVMQMTLMWGIVTYTLTFGWFAIAWFYFRPKSIKKFQKSIDELIHKFEGVQGQFEANS